MQVVKANSGRNIRFYIQLIDGREKLLSLPLPPSHLERGQDTWSSSSH